MNSVVLGRYFYSIPLNEKGREEINYGQENTENMIDGQFDAEEIGELLADKSLLEVGGICDEDICDGESSVIYPQYAQKAIDIIKSKGHENVLLIKLLEKSKEIGMELYLDF